MYVSLWIVKCMSLVRLLLWIVKYVCVIGQSVIVAS